MKNAKPRGYYCRGYLPHFDPGEYCQFVTFRLADAVPKELIGKWKEQLNLLPEDERKEKIRRSIEQYIDKGCGSCLLAEHAVGRLMMDALLCQNRTQYVLHDWVIMPNHVHALLTPGRDQRLAEIIGGWKSISARKINSTFGRTGKLWQEDYFDRFIRDENHFSYAAAYIANNPVKAGLCDRPEDWLCSSRHGMKKR